LQPHLNLKTLVEGCLNANRESQNSFYRYFYDSCFNVCASYCQTNDDVQEVVNDGFLKIFKNLQSFNAMYSDYETSLRGWIKRIMINTAIDHYSKTEENIRFQKSMKTFFIFLIRNRQ
jgi:RNA polymerase sigma-70 factor (ECF subfamily)